MKEILNEDTFLNGDPIPEAKTIDEWLKAGEAGKPSWCYYENTLADGEKYGKNIIYYSENKSYPSDHYPVMAKVSLE